MEKMWRNRSSVNGGGTDHQVTSDSRFDVLVSSIPVLALVLSWTSRLLLDRKAAVQDAAAVVVASSIWHRRLLYLFILNVLPNSSILLSLIMSVAILFTIAVLHYGSVAERFGTLQEMEEEQPQPGLPPLMIPCRTTHTRLFPTKHSFSYSYLFVGIPVGWIGRAGTILSADHHRRTAQGDSRSTWFSVDAEDYLERGTHPDGLRGKLFRYLRSQGVAPKKYSHALLVTAPRFLGFSFNPVSFWYLYNEANFLQAMVVEVNNTFDERRIYFMEREMGCPTAPEEGERPFKHSWEKDFHVSPFNSRDGSYSLEAADPYANTIAGNFKVDCNIVLKTADHKAKIVARVFSTDSVIDAMSMTRWQTLAFVLRWWWVGLMTSPRILREARILWLKKLQVYYRPEVLKTSIGRQESRREAQLEPYFRLLLERLVQCSQNGLRFSYIPAAGPRRGSVESIELSQSSQTNVSRLGIEVRVLTPAFYSQFVRFVEYRDAFGKLCFDAPDSEKFIFISDRAAFQQLLSKMEQEDRESTEAPLRWRILAWLRGKKPMYSALFHTAVNGDDAADRRVRGLSPFDMLVMNNSNHVSRRCYSRNVIALLISDRLAFGWTEILRFYGAVIWAFLVYVATSSGQNLLSPRSAAGVTDHFFLTTLGILGLHLWAYGIRLV